MGLPHGFAAATCLPSKMEKLVGGPSLHLYLSSVLIGILGHRIQHCRGLRLGDPLSTLLFILAFDPLQRILGKATELGVLTKLRGRTARLRTSMYVDDAIIFVNPPREDVIALKEIL